MIKLEYLKLNVGQLVLRFYLLMAVVLLGGFSGMWWIAMLALPIFMSAILGVRVIWTAPKSKMRMTHSQKSFSKTKAV